MNGGVSCTQFDCDVDEHVIFSRVAQMSCTRRKTRGSWSLICLVFPMFWLFRHAVWKNTFDQKSSVVDFRKSTWR